MIDDQETNDAALARDGDGDGEGGSGSGGRPDGGSGTQSG